MTNHSDRPSQAGLFIIQDIRPSVDSGRYPVKTEVDERFKVSAVVFRDGHDIIKVFLKYREKYSSNEWHAVEMGVANSGLDIWEAEFIVGKNARYLYTVEAYTDHLATWLSEIKKKQKAAMDISSELLEGEQLVKKLMEQDNLPASQKDTIAALLQSVAKASGIDAKIEIFSEAILENIYTQYAVKDDATTFEPALELIADRVRARYASWYEIFPRSQGTVPGKAGDFNDCIRRLPEIKDMGFDVLYFPPIHPIGKTNRKGPNNALTCSPGDPGSPYAIGSDEGGHMAIEHGLGTMADFERLVSECHKIGMEVALDFAINCSPDHPYVKAHPEWFYKRPDGTIKYAENPPKKYQDIYPLNFRASDGVWEEIWTEQKNIFKFWIDHGVRIFRVDNPHTKPVAMWQWIINEIQREYPDVIFLSEAFTKPAMMKVLAKAGFTQSYSYFTWRNFKDEITDYFTELTNTDVSDYLRANLFANTPDILPTILQTGGRPAFMIRAVLAATLSSVYGIYAGFELCENEAIAGTEEYLNSEKYEVKVWDWDRPGNIKRLIKSLNHMRHENPALQLYKNLRFHECNNGNILFYSKATEDRKNIVLCVVNLDPFNRHDTRIRIPLEEYSIPADTPFGLKNLLTGSQNLTKDPDIHISLDPKTEPAHIYSLAIWTSREGDFDYF